MSSMAATQLPAIAIMFAAEKVEGVPVRVRKQGGSVPSSARVEQKNCRVRTGPRKGDSGTRLQISPAM